MHYPSQLKKREKICYGKNFNSKKSYIAIVRITTDNLPVQIQALSHESPESIQYNFIEMKPILHFRCTCHLLDLAYKYWSQ